MNRDTRMQIAASLRAAADKLLASDLHERIADALGWSMKDVQSMSLSSLRGLVRPVNPKLADEISGIIERGEHIKGPRQAGSTKR